MENAYCYEHDQKLLKKISEEQARLRRKEALAKQTGLQDGSLLARLVDLQLTPETLLTLPLVPLVEIAWANGTMDERQREAVLAVARQKELPENPPAAELLNNWLQARPGPEWLETWKQYLKFLCQQMSMEKFKAMKSEMMDHWLFVAEATGGVLRFQRVSRKKRAKIEELEAMLNEFAAVFSCPDRGDR
jgi:hypothetical protein